jgi:hypothetical protein
MNEEKNQLAESLPRLSDEEMSEREIDENLMETFPSSDPPSWTLGTNHKDTHVDSDTDKASNQSGRDSINDSRPSDGSKTNTE